jgi:hypothetical protein
LLRPSRSRQAAAKIARIAALHKISLEMVRRNAYCAVQHIREFGGN